MPVPNWIRCYVTLDLRAYNDDDEVVYMLLDYADEHSTSIDAITDIDATAAGKRWSIDLSIDIDLINDPVAHAEDYIRHCCSVLRSCGILYETDIITGATSNDDEATAWFKTGAIPKNTA